MTNILDQVETLLRIIMERKLFTWLPGNINVRDVIQKVIATLPEDGYLSGSFFTLDIMIKVAPASYGLWFNNQVELVELGNILIEEIKTTRDIGECAPIFHIFGDPNLTGDEIIISAIQVDPDRSDTTYLESLPPDDEEDRVVTNPYLIGPSDNVINIVKTVTNLGRRVDNDIVVDDAKVSRQHAQIRFSPKGCILFDLNSTGGTYINDKRITQQKLRSGDVISLAGVTFIFGEESLTDTSSSTASGDHSKTRPPDGQDDLPLEYIG